MTKYNESLKRAGILLALDGLLPPSIGAASRFDGGKPEGDRRPVRRGEGGDRRVLDHPGEVERRGDRMGDACCPVPADGRLIEVRRMPMLRLPARRAGPRWARALRSGLA